MSFFKPKRIPLQKTKSDDPFTTTESIDSSLYIDDEDPGDAFYLKGSNLKTKLESYNQLIQKIRDYAIKLENHDYETTHHDASGQRSDLSFTFKELESLETSIRFDFSSLSKSLDATSFKKVNYYNNLIKLFSEFIPNAKTTFQIYRSNYLQYLLSNYGTHPYGSDFELYIRQLKSDDKYLAELNLQTTQEDKETVTTLRNASLELSKIDSFFESLNIIQSELQTKKFEGALDSNNEKMVVNQNNKYGAVPAITVSSIEDGYLSHQDKRRKKRKRMIWILVIMCLAMVGVGLGCGLGLGLKHQSSNSADSSNKSVSTSADSSNKVTSGHASFASADDIKSSSSGKSSSSHKSTSKSDKSATFATADELKSKKHKSAKSHSKPKKKTGSGGKATFATSDELKAKSKSGKSTSSSSGDEFSASPSKARAHANYVKSKKAKARAKYEKSKKAKAKAKANRHEATKLASKKAKNVYKVNKSHKAITKSRKALARKKHLLQGKK